MCQYEWVNGYQKFCTKNGLVKNKSTSQAFLNTQYLIWGKNEHIKQFQAKFEKIKPQYNGTGFLDKKTLKLKENWSQTISLCNFCDQKRFLILFKSTCCSLPWGKLEAVEIYSVSMKFSTSSGLENMDKITLL